MKDFFVSYNRADRGWAEWIAWQLEEAGYEVVIQAWDFRPGGNFVLDMQKASAGCERTVAVLSPSYLAALYTQPEWAAAFAEDPTGSEGLLLPVRVAAVELEGLQRAITYIDLVGLGEEEAEEALMAGARRERGKPESEPEFPGAQGKEHAVVERRPEFPPAAKDRPVASDDGRDAGGAGQAPAPTGRTGQPRWAWWVVGIVVPILAALIAIGPLRYRSENGFEIYIVRATVLEPQGLPVEDAKVWSSFGGEPKRVAGGWQFDILRAAAPASGELTLYASRAGDYLRGQRTVRLGAESNIAASIQLERDRSATIRGQVQCPGGSALAGARVSILGYEDEGVVTSEQGQFLLPAHAAPGESVRLVVVHGELTDPQYHLAGETPVVFRFPCDG